MVVLAAATVILPLIMPALASELGGAGGLSWERRGRLFAALGASFVAALVLSGPLADRTHPRPFALAGHLLVAAGLGLLAAARGFAGAVAACIALGLGAGLLDMVLSPLVARASGVHAASALNRLHAAYSIGAVAVSALGAGWLRGEISWRGLPLSLTAVPLAMAMGFAVLPLPRLREASHGTAGARAVLGHPQFGRWVLVFFGSGAAMAGLSQWLPALARAEAGWSAAAAGTVLSLFLLGMGVSRLAIAPLLHGYAPERVLAYGLSLTVALTLLARVWGAAGPAVISLVAAGVPCGILWPTALAAASARIRGGGGSLFGWLSAAGNTGCFVAPWLIGLAADRIGLRAALPIAVLPGAIALWRLVQTLDSCRPATSKDWTARPGDLQTPRRYVQ